MLMFENKVWSQAELNLGNPVSNQTNVMHLEF